MGKPSWWKLGAFGALSLVAMGCQNQDPNKSALWGPNMPASASKGSNQGNAFQQPAPAFPTANGTSATPTNRGGAVSQIPTNAFSSNTPMPNIPAPMPPGSQFGGANFAQPGQPFTPSNLVPPGAPNLQPVANFGPQQNLAPVNSTLAPVQGNGQAPGLSLPPQNIQPFNPPIPPQNPGLGELQPNIRASFPQGN